MCVGVWYMCGRVVHACVGGVWGWVVVYGDLHVWDVGSVSMYAVCVWMCGVCGCVGWWRLCGVCAVCGVCVHHSVCECMVNE